MLDATLIDINRSRGVCQTARTGFLEPPLEQRAYITRSPASLATLLNGNELAYTYVPG